MPNSSIAFGVIHKTSASHSPHQNTRVALVDRRVISSVNVSLVVSVRLVVVRIC